MGVSSSRIPRNFRLSFLKCISKDCSLDLRNLFSSLHCFISVSKTTCFFSIFVTFEEMSLNGLNFSSSFWSRSFPIASSVSFSGSDSGVSAPSGFFVSYLYLVYVKLDCLMNETLNICPF